VPSDTLTETDERDTMRHYLHDKGVRASIVGGAVIAACFTVSPTPHIGAVAVIWAGVAAWSVVEARRKLG
jgi:hypothetical protein